jgi:outer membrane protein OmpA-like peptidoglycan-associated protein
MKFVPTQRLVSLALLAALTCGAHAQEAPVTPAAAPETPAGSDQALDLGTKVPDSAAIKEGLFPEDACKELEASGFKCMGFKPAIRYSLPASSFALGSAVVPEGLKRQLDVFADVLRSKRGSGRQVRVIGHADASGSQAGNLTLSRSRAEAVKDYLVKKGAESSMLIAVGVGAAQPKNPANPKSPENRRVEIGRQN